MKIAILGGGVGAMTAPYWLTNPTQDGPPADHDITVYQLGWRLGGKGAAGRNADAGDRIEEHGLHDIDSLLANTRPDGRFRYEWLASNNPSDRTDDERFLSQFFRINNQPTETYVLSVAGSTKYRLDPANPGYENLVLAGDWVRNGFAIGCVESAVLGAMKGVRRFCPGMVIVE